MLYSPYGVRKEEVMNKVYVCNYAGHNIHLAERYGELVILTEGKVNIFNTDRLLNELAQKLKDYKKQDYILLSGSPVIVFLISLVLSHKVDEFNMIIYNTKLGDYEIRRVFAKNIRYAVEEVMK